MTTSHRSGRGIRPSLARIRTEEIDLRAARTEGSLGGPPGLGRGALYPFVEGVQTAMSSPFSPIAFGDLRVCVLWSDENFCPTFARLS